MLFICTVRIISIVWILICFSLNVANGAISHHCSIFMNNKLKRICTIGYPRLVKWKYADKYVKASLSYTIFELEDKEGYFFITHGLSDLNKCDIIRINSQHTYDCADAGDIIRLPLAILHCLPFHTQISDDLVEYCVHVKTRSNYTAMHYVDGTTLYKDDDDDDDEDKYNHEEDSGMRTCCLSIYFIWFPLFHMMCRKVLDI